MNENKQYQFWKKNKTEMFKPPEFKTTAVEIKTVHSSANLFP